MVNYFRPFTTILDHLSQFKTILNLLGPLGPFLISMVLVGLGWLWLVLVLVGLGWYLLLLVLVGFGWSWLVLVLVGLLTKKLYILLYSPKSISR